MVTSPKQDKSFAEATHRFNIWVGAVRSGKTYSSIHRFIYDLKHGPKGDAMIIGVNRSSIHRNILTTLYNTLGFPCVSQMANKDKLYGRDVYFVGAPDVSAVTTIQGSTLALAYVDEAVAIPEPFWKMLETRLSVPGAKLLATCNPEGPAHWLKKEYLDRSEVHDIVAWQFNLDDNPVLDNAYKKAIKSSFSGVFYQRYILGEWALATGAVFDSWCPLNVYDRDYQQPDFYAAALDYGTVNPTSCHIAAISPNKWPQIRIEKEYYFDSAKYGRSKTDRELAMEVKDFLQYTPITALYVDPAAASLKLELRNLDLPVVDANNDVLFGIKSMTLYIAGKNLIIHKSCKNLIEQCQSYAWDPVYAAKGEDKPIKKNDHAVDSCRYLIASVFKTGLQGYADTNMSHEQIVRKITGEWGVHDTFNQDVSRALY